MTILLVYKQSKRKGRGKNLRSRWDLVARVWLSIFFRNKLRFIGWVYLMLKSGNYRVMTRLPSKKGFTPLLKFEVRRVEDGDEKPKLHITISNDSWGVLHKIE